MAGKSRVPCGRALASRARRRLVAMAPELSIVIPMFNEEAVLPLLAQRLRLVADGLATAYEVVAVDDGSRDDTAVVLQRLRREWPQLRVLRLRANAGHQAAISAGLARARGAFVVTLDADLQDPPEVIPEMLRTAQADGVDVVYGVRQDRSTDSAFKRLTARAFYRSVRVLAGTSAPVDAGDFRLMSRATVDAVNALPDHNRVLRFVVPALGFPSATVGYRREERAAGRSKYPLARMIRLSVDSVTGFSIAPLRAATWLGLCGGFAALALLVYALAARGLGHTLPGWTSTVVAVAAMGAVQLLCLGVLGEYVGRMYAQLQGRPTYFVAYDSVADGSAPAGPPPDGSAHDRSDADSSATDSSAADASHANAQRAATEPSPPATTPSRGPASRPRGTAPPGASTPAPRSTASEPARRA
jgi:glycosyltransferase involved in cell wall biosynthesis